MGKKFFAALLAAVLAVSMLVPLVAYASSGTSAGLIMDDRETSISTNLTLTVGKSRDLNGFVQRKYNNEDSGEMWYLVGPVSWSSSNKDVVSVTEKGVATAHKVGTARITAIAWDNFGRQRVHKIVVGVESTSEGSTSSSFEISAGTWLDLRQLGALDSGSKEITWATSNAGIASVDSDGLVMAREIGRCAITASYKGGNGAEHTIKYQVRVTSAVLLNKTRESVIVLNEGDKIDVGRMYYPNYQQQPSTLSRLSCTTSSNGILSVSGLSVSAKSVGTGHATIRLDDWKDEEICHRLTIVVKK